MEIAQNQKGSLTNCAYLLDCDKLLPHIYLVDGCILACKTISVCKWRCQNLCTNDFFPSKVHKMGVLMKKVQIKQLNMPCNTPNFNIKKVREFQKKQNFKPTKTFLLHIVPCIGLVHLSDMPWWLFYCVYDELKNPKVIKWKSPTK